MKKIDESYFKVQNEMQKNNVEDIIEKDEKILLRLKPNKTAYVWSAVMGMLPFALIWLIFDLTAIIFICQVPTFPTGVLIFIIVFFAFHLTPVWIWIGQIVNATIGYKNIEYVFTSKRIIIRSGVIGIDFKTINYSDIEGVNLKVSFIDRMLKVGDIYIQAVTQSSVLNDINNPYAVLSSIQKITLDIKTDINYPNDLRPSTNHGYKTQYSGSDVFTEIRKSNDD